MKGLYAFTDTTPATGENKIYPAEAFKIDGTYLEDLVADYQTLQVTGRELLSQEITTKKVGISDGEKIQYVRRTPSTITVKYLINARSPADFRQDFHLLNDVLGGQDHQISFHDDPTRYFIATLQSISDPPPGANSVIATFSFLIPDGVSYSTNISTAVVDETGKINIDNRGTYPTYPIITTKMKSDNGLVAMVNDNGGVLEFGNPDEIDGVTKQKSDKAFYCG
ncbi:distal tail protein Dit, partial [Lapidilactobacillus bayanensis]|uniref:distal tail protein Dit n=1 Tax=Lapidilactobacillus bayanensis TaxID=2485998 RepID=UPI0013DDC58B